MPAWKVPPEVPALDQDLYVTLRERLHNDVAVVVIPQIPGRRVQDPDSTRIAFTTVMSSATYRIALQSPTGGRPEIVLQGPFSTVTASDWSRDGKVIAFSNRSEKTRDDIWVLPLEGDRKAAAFLQTPADEFSAAFSPGGDWIAYESNESGQEEIYVQHYPANGSTFQISSGGGSSPRWSRDGKEIFYQRQSESLVSVPVTAGATFVHGQARTLFENVPFLSPFQPSADGQRFLAAVTEGTQQAPPVVVITNWSATLKR